MVENIAALIEEKEVSEKFNPKAKTLTSQNVLEEINLLIEKSNPKAKKVASQNVLEEINLLIEKSKAKAKTLTSQNVREEINLAIPQALGVGLDLVGMGAVVGAITGIRLWGKGFWDKGKS